MSIFAGFFKDDHALGVIGIVVGTVLFGLVRFLLPKEERDRSRIAGVYLALAIVAALADWIVPDETTIARICEFFWWFFVLASCGRSLVLLAVDVIVGKRTQRTPPRIFRDLTQAVVYVVVLMLTLRAVGVEPGSLLTTSALLTAVIGLALQDTLGNLVSGLALQMQRPFEVGDWIQFETDPRHVGQVTEANWRATSVMTSDLVEVIVPNAMLARAPIRNYSRPSKLSRRSISVLGSYAVPPPRVHDAIIKALDGAPGVLTAPPVWVQTHQLAENGIEYTVYFFIDDYAGRELIDGVVRDRVWYALQRAQIEIPYPVRTVHMHHVSDDSRERAHDRELARRDEILRCVDFFDVLPPEAHRALAASAEVRLFAPGETIVRQGDTAAELYVIDRGEVDVEIAGLGRRKLLNVARLGPGKFFGEMALLTGEARTATVRAATECALIVIGHDAFHDTIASVKDVAEKLSELVGARMSELEEVAEGSRPSLNPTPERSQRLLSQIKSFFKL